MIMMQSMGTQPINFQKIMPFMILSDSDKSSDESLMLMVMLNSLTGGLSTQTGFDSNFNMILPILMKDCDDSDADCKKKQKNMMVMMMAMQSQVYFKFTLDRKFPTALVFWIFWNKDINYIT